jgi:hypothetical protein
VANMEGALQQALGRNLRAYRESRGLSQERGWRDRPDPRCDAIDSESRFAVAHFPAARIALASGASASASQP